MDEIDAALDFKNVSIVANYIKDRTKNAQFVIISLRNNMFELADRLVGIYKTHDATKSVTINPKMFENAVNGTSSSSSSTSSSSGEVVKAKPTTAPTEILADRTNMSKA
jgi:structural maintenance of chromosome 4